MAHIDLKTSNASLSRISDILEERYGHSDLGNKTDPLEELLFILLTVKTDHRHYDDLWTRFRSRFPTVEALLAASEEEVARAISFGGLQRQKAQRIMKVIRTIHERCNSIDLAFLKDMTDEEVELFLLSLDGVGKKIARCVMMYSLNRQVFPVDSNVFRICKRLGILDPGIKEEDAHDMLQDIVPERLRRQLHVGLVSLGRDLCTDRSPKCGICPIRDSCGFGGEGTT